MRDQNNDLQASKTIDDYHDLVLALFGVAVAAVMLVAGALFMLALPDAPEPLAREPTIVTSSVD